ncbi:MAG TPA: PIG-L family deacetylase [Candidatus Eisenbacteria bacterium]|nr:PIG-L family deacetylase [Candidatus Eisenbacteria bacterium]
MGKRTEAWSPEQVVESGRARVLILVAHPDDEWLGAGSLLPILRDRWIVQVTDGAPRDLKDARRLGFRARAEYARARRREALAALRHAGIPRTRRIELGFADQEVVLGLKDLVRQLQAILERLRPDVVLTHSYEGGHPDHDAISFALAFVARRIACEGGIAPERIEMAGYHSRADGGMEAGVFLHPNLAARTRPEERVRLLTARERARKRNALRQFASQRSMIDLFPLETERFRQAPPYDFRRPPHPGSLLYERLALGPGGDRFRREVEKVLAIGPSWRAA